MSIVASLIFWLFWIGFFSLSWSHVLVSEASGWFSSCTNCWGDWSAHLSYTASFAYGNNWPPQLPIMAGHKFSYPFVVDLLSAVLVKLGLNLRLAMIIPGWILSLGLVWLLVKLGRKLTGKKRVGMITSFLFLFNGGLTFLPGLNIQWLNIVVSQLVPQRGFLLGMPLAIVVYLCFWNWLKKGQKKYLLTAGIITGLLPLIHFHSMVVIVLVAGWFLVINFSWQWLYFFLPLMLVSVGQVWGFYGSSLGLRLINFKPGWMAGEQNWLGFWVINLGMILPLAISGLIKAKKEVKRFAGPFWGLFILGNLFIFQPFDWDNTKIFSHWYLMMAVLGGIMIDRMLANKRWWLKTGGMLLFILSILPGFLDTVKFNQYKKSKYLFFSNQQLALAEEVKRKIKPEAVVLTANNHNHWLPALTGRKIVLGYPAWLWSYGIEYQQREKDVKNIYQDEEVSEDLLEQYQVDYVLVGPDERRMVQINEDFFQQKFPLVFNLNDSNIYQTR